MSSIILTCNAGSSNTKLAAFDHETLEHKGYAVTHNIAETVEWLCSIGTLGIIGISHRVVHGGQDFIQPTIITPIVLEKLKTYIPLAPLHQPAALKLIEETQKLYPKIQQIACFDTAFHHTMPELERMLPLPRKFFDEGILRYGFHGLSYQHVAEVIPKHERVVVAHLGGGSSACAMKNMQSVASTMGFSTLDGLMMGTRSGAIDAGVILHLLQQKNMTAQQVSDLLYNESGLKGVSGISGNMQELLQSTAPAATQAVELYCALAAKQIAGLMPSIGGLDALAFTGGIGENAEVIRNKITQHLAWVGNFKTYVIPTDEEIVLARAWHKIGTNSK